MAKRRRGNGEGTINRRKDGRWEARITIGRKPDGKPKRATLYGKTRQEVAEKLTVALNEKRKGTFVEPHKTTLAEWLDRWLSTYQKSAVDQSTYTLQEMLIRAHIKPALGHVPLTKLKSADLQEFYTDRLARGRTDGKAWMVQITNGREVEGSEGRCIVYGKTRKEVQDKAKKVLRDQYNETVVEPHKMGLSSQSVRHIHNVLNKALKQAMQEGLVVRNVAQVAKPPKVVRLGEMNTLSRDEVGRFLKAVQGERFQAAFFLDLATGLRRGELLALRWSDFNVTDWKNADLKNVTLQVRKSLSRVKQEDGTTKLEFGDLKTPKSRRPIPVPEEVARELKAHKARQNEEKLGVGEAYRDKGLVFATVLGTPVEPRKLTRRWEHVLQNANIPYTRFHNVRHTFATLLLEAGEHPKVVQELLGHASIVQTIDTYSHVIPSLKERAAVTMNGILRMARGEYAVKN